MGLLFQTDGATIALVLRRALTVVVFPSTLLSSRPVRENVYQELFDWIRSRAFS
jgi:hypothetical protein